MSMKRCGFYSTYWGGGGTVIPQCNSLEEDTRGCLYKAMSGGKRRKPT